MSTAPLTRSASKRCVSCHRPAPVGHFTDIVPDPHRPGRTVHIEHDACRGCRHRSILPGRPFR